jgi:hypothetical protein
MYCNLKIFLPFCALLLPKSDNESYKRNPIANCGAILFFTARNCIGKKSNVLLRNLIPLQLTDFYTRYKYDGNDALLPLTLTSFHLLLSPSLWKASLWKDNLEKLLNNACQYQIQKKSVKVKCSLESWYYFIQRMSLPNPLHVMYWKNHTEKLMHYNFTLSSHSCRVLFRLLQIDKMESLMCARTTFGNTFGIGIRNIAPNKGVHALWRHN